MPVTVGVNKRTVVHKESQGKAIAFPDVCLTPVGNSTVPIPYPNIAQSQDLENGAKTVTADGQPLGHEKSYFATSTGDEAGSQKGVASGTTKGKAEFVNFSFDVEVEGKGVVRAMDQMVLNNKNTPATPLNQPPLVQELVEEPPEVPEQGKVEAKFLDPFDEPLEGLEMEVEAEGKKEVKQTMANGQLFHLPDSESVEINLNNQNQEQEAEEA